MAAAASSPSAAAPLRVSVKWNSNEYKDLEVDVNESLTLFKTQLFTLTGVPPERQKLMAKGKLLKEMEDLQRAAGGKGDSVKLVMLGTAEGAELKQPTQKTVFLEDLTPAEQARLLREKNIEPLPSGIANLGNTCYLASVLQMLRPCHELTAAIRTYIVSNASTAALASGSSGASHRLGLAIKDFYAHWENSSQAAQPLLLNQGCLLHVNGAAGLAGEVYMQQDAEECLMCLTNVLGEMLPKSRTAAAIAALPTSYPKAQNFVEALFGFDTLLSSWREKQGEEAAAHGSRHVEKKLEKRIEFTCFLGTVQHPVNTLDEGMKFSLGEERIELPPDAAAGGLATRGTAATVGGSTTLVRSSLFASLPFYLIVHFMRFEWKRSGGQTEKAKVCKSLKFSSTLDLHTFCTDELKEQLRVGRAVMALRRDREAGDPGTASDIAAKPTNKSPDKTNCSSNTDSSGSDSSGKDDAAGASGDAQSGGTAAQGCLPNGSDMHVETEQQQKQVEVSGNEEKVKIFPTGVFNLLGIVTHQGRHADSGHYVGWAKKDQREPRRIEREQREKQEQEAAEAARLEAEGKTGEGESRGYVRPQRRAKPDDTWLKFDDDKVYEMPWSQIDLAGGRSDYHIAYLLMYRHCMVEPTEEELQTVERMHQEQLREMQALAEQKRRKAAEQAAATSVATMKKD